MVTREFECSGARTVASTLRSFVNTNARVTIIIDNYNYGRFLDEAITSALDQTYASVEVIVVDDGSTDDSHIIIGRYGKHIIPILKPNGGQASAFNAGFACSTGDIVIFLDADDVLLPETATRVVQSFQGQPGVAKVQYRMEIVNEVGTRTGRILPHPKQPMPNGDLRRQVMTFPADLAWMGTSGNAFAARVLRTILPIPEEQFRTLADYYLCHLAPLFGPIISLPEVGALYRIHSSNMYSSHRLNVRSIRSSFTHWGKTAFYVAQYANQLGLGGGHHEASQVLSVAYLINRMISLKLAPEDHPVIKDTCPRLLQLGIKAAYRRFDVSLPMRVLYMGWFAAMALAPRRLAWWLAEQAMLPDQRGPVNSVLAALQGTPTPQTHPPVPMRMAAEVPDRVALAQKGIAGEDLSRYTHAAGDATDEFSPARHLRSVDGPGGATSGHAGHGRGA